MTHASPLSDITLVLRRRAPLPSVERLGGLLPAQRRHLSAGVLASRFGPSLEDLDTLRSLVAWEPEVSIHGLFLLGGAVRLRGPASALVRLQQALGPRVRGGFGLEALAPGGAEPPGRFVPQEGVPPRSFRTHPDGHTGVTYTAPQVAALYAFPDFDGREQCIGLIELGGGCLQEDLEVYFRELGLPLPRITFVGDNTLHGFELYNLEVTMDVQLVGALCPRAHIVVYNSQEVSIRGYFNALCMALEDDVHRPSVLSVSWSFPEFEGLGPTPLQAQFFEESLTLAALMGVTVCSSSGDQGSSIPVFPPFTRAARQGYSQACLTPSASFAATSPLVLACGGTSLASVKGNRLRKEVVWNRLAERMVCRIGEDELISSLATGGGISMLFPRPAYQRLARVPPFIHQQWEDFALRAQTPFAGRGTPDVAANADLMTGFRVYFHGAWVPGGGTSAAAPLWAALVLLINQGSSERQGREVRTGWLNPLLYRMRLREKRAIVRPITEGSNGAYSAHPDLAWNACTGLGSPRGRALARALGAL